MTTATAEVKSVTAATLNVRSGPGTSYDVVGTAPQGSSWALVGTSGSWRKVSYAGAARWMHGSYLGGGSSGGLPTSAAGFVQLPASGAGFYAYTGADRRWGVPSLVYNFMDGAADWKAVHPTWPRIGVGDISLQNGGTMDGHVSHKVGKDVDLRPVRVDVEGPTTIFQSNYSSARTKDWIVDHVKPKLNVNVIFFNDPAIEGPLSYVQPWPNHDNHMHVRIY